MDLTVTLHYPAAPAEVAAMFADPDFTREARFATAQLDAAEREAISVDTAREGEAFTVTIDGPVPASAVPAKVRSYLPGSVRMHGVDRWEAPAADGSRAGTLEASLSGVPARISATQELAPGADGASTTRTVHATVSVTVPLIGPMIERTAAGYVEEVLRGEEQAAQRWLGAR